MTFVLRVRESAEASRDALDATTNRSASLQARVREAIWRVDKDQPVGAMLTMDQRLSNSLSLRRFSVTLLLVFGVVALALAAVGLYGVLAFTSCSGAGRSACGWRSAPASATSWRT